MMADIKTIPRERVHVSKTKLLEDTITRSKTHFFGVRFDNISKETAVNAIKAFLTDKKKNKPRKVFFTNVHTIYIAEHDPVFAEAINNADLVLPDGSGLKIAGKIFSKPVKENLNGTDFTPLILETAVQLGSKVYLLGAKEEIVSECVFKLKKKYPGLIIAGYHSGYFSPAEENMILEEIEKISPDILLVAMGSPIQEMFVNRITARLKNTVCFAVGGLFDFISGGKKRAPVLFRNLGLEWLFRFMQDPKTKWERIVIEIPAFLSLVITARFFTNSIYSSPDRRISLIL
jgi:N-acetylglucosaminyldiphosphoundecaprenol N-acetyl-beta-D-mannosaminyltransferase